MLSQTTYSNELNLTYSTYQGIGVILITILLALSSGADVLYSQTTTTQSLQLQDSSVKSVEPIDSTLLPYRIVVGAGLNGNIHQSQFRELPGVPNCCTEFTGGFGLGAYLKAGIETSPSRPLLGLKYRGGIGIGYSSIGATLRERNEFANIITGNTVQKGVSEFTINSTLSLLTFNPYFLLEPLKNTPLSITLGFQGGLLFSTSYKQDEKLISPNNGATFENGTTTRGESSGSLPSATTFLPSVGIGIRYDVTELSKNLTLSAEASYYHGLSDIVSSLNWKVHTASIGIALLYQPRKVVEVAPPPTLPPPPPPPPTPKVLAVESSCFLDGKQIASGSTVELPLLADITNQRTNIASVVYYTANSAEISTDDERSVVQPITQILKDNPSLNVLIKGIQSSPANSNGDVVSARLNIMATYLESRGISKNRITTSVIPRRTNLRYQQLEEEQEAVVLQLQHAGSRANSFVTPMLLSSDTLYREQAETPHELRFVPTIKSDTTITKAQLTGRIDGKSINTLAKTQTAIQLPPITVQSVGKRTASLLYTVADAVGNEKTTFTEWSMNTQVTFVGNRENEIINTTTGKPEREYILGYCDFDKATFYQIDSLVIPRSKTALAEGKSIELISLTDNLGTEEHNTILAQKRVNEALRILDLKASDVSITLKPSGIADNGTPRGRTLNRAVLIRIR
jgi:outer membrane protein OmpA-like peptidoglycan-associated protein